MRFFRELLGIGGLENRRPTTYESGKQASVPPETKPVSREKILTAEQQAVEATIAQYMPILMKGIDTPEAREALQRLEKEGLTAITEQCFHCETTIIVSWFKGGGYVGGDGQFLYGAISHTHVIPKPCPRREDGKHTIGGL